MQREGHSIKKNKSIVHKRPLIIGIGGSRSGAGKTTVAEALLKHFADSPIHRFTDSPKCRWGAIKYTKTAIYSSIIDTPEILSQKDKDTARLIYAGAESVLWVQAPPEEIKDILPLAVDRLSHLRGIIVEGNSAIEFLKPDIVIFVSGRQSGAMKKSAEKALKMADIILFEDEPSIKLPARAKKFKVTLSSMSGLDECLCYIEKLLK